MRAYVLMLLCLAMLQACAGQDTRPVTAGPDSPQTGFAAIPRPSELGVQANPERTASEAAAAPSAIFRQWGGPYYALPSPHVIVDAETKSSVMAGGTSSLTYCFFNIDDGVETGMHYTRFMVEGHWIDSLPEGTHGLYIGFPDWERDQWRWQPPVDPPGGWQDLPAGEFEYQGGDNDYIVLVNYSEVDFRLNALRFETDNPASDPHDGWLYYSQHNGSDIAPTVNLCRVQPVPGSTPEPVLDAGLLEWQYHPHVATILDHTRIGYARTYGGPVEIWYCGLQGQNPSRLSWHATENRYPAGWRPDGGAFLYLQSDGAHHKDLYVRNTIVKDTALFFAPGTDVVDACWDVSTTGKYSTLITEFDYGIMDEHHNISGFTGSPTFPLEVDPSVYLDYEPDQSMPSDVCSFAFDGEGLSAARGCMFSMERNNVLPRSLYIMYYTTPGKVYTCEELIKWEGYDLRYPAVSPDGRWLAFIACPEGEKVGELYVAPFTSTYNGGEFKLADNATTRPAWYDPTP